MSSKKMSTTAIQAPPIISSETRTTIERLKRDKTQDKGEIRAGLFQLSGEPIVLVLNKLLRLKEGRVPDSYKNVVIVLINII